MDPASLGIASVALFVGFGALIGVCFGFFGMGGSFLVTPVLLLVGYPAPVAVGSGLAFVFGTSVVGALRHRALDQIDWTLAAVTTLGMLVGIELGKRALFWLDAFGAAEFALRAVYAGLLGAVGVLVLWRARRDGATADRAGIVLAETVAIRPLVTLPGGATVSAWTIFVAGLGVGVLSGCLGVGGGFLLIPVMTFGFGVPVAVAAGTSILQILVSGAFGTFVYALAGTVDVPVVAALLGGSALGTRIGAGATPLVPEPDVIRYFAVMLLAGSATVASTLGGTPNGPAPLDALRVVLLVGTALLVSGAIVRASIDALRRERRSGSPQPP